MDNLLQIQWKAYKQTPKGSIKINANYVIKKIYKFNTKFQRKFT